MKKVGIYVHIPFCTKKCPYCDFYSVVQNGEQMDEYIDTVLEAMDRTEDGICADTLYFGGGTPSLIPPKLLAAVVGRAVSRFSLDGEVTLEANPGTVSLQQLKALAGAGFNRISMGMQSASDRELEILGRGHSAQQVAQAVEMAKLAGFANISVDLMLATPYQTLESLHQTLDFLESLEVQHISAYLLKVEPGTGFDSPKIAQILPDEDLVSDCYLAACKRLEGMGFHQYEISNFAKPGYESRHNLKYWRGEEYLAFGPSAHGFLHGQRYYYPRSLQEYLDTGGQNLMSEEVQVDSLEEYLLLGLRLAEGIDLSVLYGDSRVDRNALERKLKLFQEHGLLIRSGNRVSLTPEGFLLSNSIIADLEICAGR